MPELLTESFCERCGTRYTFETPEPESRRAGRLKQARTLARGLRNFVLDDSLPLEAALADARRDDDRARATQQLEAFHRTFNFCLDCRQYTCLDCWNEAEGRCLTCAPRPGVIEPAAAVALVPLELPMPEVNGHGPSDGEASLSAVPADAAASALETPIVEVSLRDAVEAAALAAAAAPAPEAEPALVESAPEVLEPLAGSVAPTPIAEPLPAEPSSPPSPPATVEPDRPPLVPPASWPPPLPIAADHPPARPFPAAPPPPPTTAAPWPPLLPARPGEPSWPTGPSPLLPPSAFGGQAQEAALEASYGPWQASTGQIAARSAGAGIRACISCGLALSSTAHFCRRCGSRQSS